MAYLNECRLIGNLTRDVELRTTPNGHTVAKFGLATNRRYRGRDGNLQEETTFVDIECWGKTAEICNQYLRRGSQAYIGGRLKFDSWEDRNTGQKRNKITVVAENVQFLDRPSTAQQASYVPQYQATSHQPAPPQNQEWNYSSSAPQDSSSFSSDSDYDPSMDEPPF